MKILFIGSFQSETSTERTSELIRILKKGHELVLLKPEGNWTRRRAFFPLRAWERLAITRQLILQGSRFKNIDMVFCKDIMHAFPGYWIAKKLKRPLIWESEGSMKAFWEDSHHYPQQVLPWMLVERWLAKRVDFLFTVTERDRRAYAEQGTDPNKTAIIPVCIHGENLSQKTKEEARQAHHLPQGEILFLFFAHFNYLPNQKALAFLNEQVAPLLPNKLLLCGKGRLPKKLHPKIQYLGFVPTEKLYDLIRAADVCLAPIWEARGTITKVLDMLAHGTPTVITPVIRQGIPEIADGRHALIAKNKGDFIQKTLLLSRDTALRKKLGRFAAEIVCPRYDWKTHENKLLETLDQFAPFTI